MDGDVMDSPAAEIAPLLPWW